AGVSSRSTRRWSRNCWIPRSRLGATLPCSTRPAGEANFRYFVRMRTRLLLVWAPGTWGSSPPPPGCLCDPASGLTHLRPRRRRRRARRTRRLTARPGLGQLATWTAALKTSLLPGCLCDPASGLTHLRPRRRRRRARRTRRLTARPGLGQLATWTAALKTSLLPG